LAEVDVEVDDEGWTTGAPGIEAFARRAADAALGAVGGGAVVILLTDDATVADLNRRFRAKDSATNVLSFPAARLPGEDAVAGAAGDIALALDVCRTEASARGISLADHLSHLVIHGVLHLAGHDHADDTEATKMETLETSLLAGLGISDPYQYEHPDTVPEIAHG
jgi:probable rRNA maturation factor